MQRWLAIAGVVPLIAAAMANAQANRSSVSGRSLAPKTHPRVNFRLGQEPASNQFDLPSTAFVAQSQVGPNSQIGFHLINVSRPKLGPEWRTDGRIPRSRRPAVSFTFRF